MLHSQNVNIPKNFLIILVGPWFFYLLILFVFQVKFISFNTIIIAPILLSLILSIIFFLFGFRNSASNIKFQNLLRNKERVREISGEPPLIKLIILLALIGCSLSLYFDVIRALNNETFFNLREQGNPMLYSLRIAKNVEVVEITGSNLQLISKVLFPLSFFFYVSNFTKKYIFFQWIIIILSLASNLVTGGRFYFLYFLIIYLFSYSDYKNIKFVKYFNLKNLIIALLILILLLWSFSLRIPSNFDLVTYYKILLGVKSIGLEEISFGVFNNLKDAFLVLIIYITHSIHVLSLYYDQFNFDAFSYGGYTFNLIFRIINTIFGTNLASIQSYVFIDLTFGKYATFAKTLLADFGLIGMFIFYSICSYYFGISYNYKKFYSSFKVIYYWLLTFFLIAPMKGIISSGFINLMFCYVIIYAIIEIKMINNSKQV